MTTSNIHKNEDGSYLRVLDLDSVPFEIKRIFLVSSENNIGCQRGGHAHHKCRQNLICLKGEIEILYENKETKGMKILRPGESFLHENMEWLIMVLTKRNSMLLSLCSEEYDEKDYIRDYDSFKKLL